MPRRKLRSAETLRARVLEFLQARGGVQVTESHFNGKECILGGDVRVPLTKGALIVHLPSDDDFGLGLDINTRFAEDAEFPHDANPYSGKWNFPHYENEDELYQHFTMAVDRLPLETP